MTKMKKQQGFVSIITIITLSILLSLLTVAFVRVMVRSQRQTLDAQLSTQANYAAETGINDALKAIMSNPTAISANDTDCAATPITPAAAANVANQNKLGTGVSGAASEEYTCQLISSGVKDVLATMSDQGSKMYPVHTDTTDARSLTIEWEDQAAQSNFSAGAPEDYPSIGSWGANTPAMLRIALYAPCPTGCINFDRNTLINNQKNFFIKPGVSAGTLDYASADGTATLGDCQLISNSRPFACKITINNITANTSAQNSLFLKITPLYGSAAMRFMAINTASGSPLALYGAQYRIDVTGKANDVYRRLEVRVPLPTFDSPGIGVESASVCKKFEWTGSAKTYDVCP